MTKYDVVVIGAGPAGASAALFLEETNHTYLIVDKETFPRNKPCAGILSPKINSLVKIPEKLKERPLDGYRMFSPSGVVVESLFPSPGSIVERNVFDTFLLQSLKNTPVQITIKNIFDEKHHLKIMADNWSAETCCVIGADGPYSIVKKYCNIPTKRIAIAAQTIIALPSKTIEKRIGNWFEVYYTLHYGYGWISPMKNHLKIGIGILSDHIQGDIWQELTRFLNHPFIQKKSEGGKIVRREAHVIPLSGPLDRFTGTRAILAGDAGGFVDPSTGEGIFYAMKTGRIAAGIIDRALNNKEYNTQFLEKNYTAELEKYGILGLRAVDFIDKTLATTDDAERYVKRLGHFIQSRHSSQTVQNHFD